MKQDEKNKKTKLNSENRFYYILPEPFMEPKADYPVDIVYITYGQEVRAI